VLHVFEATSAIGGRHAFEGSMLGVGDAPITLLLEGLLVLLPLLVHIVLGLHLWARPPEEPSPHATPALRTIQRGSGLVVLVFLAFHLAHTFVLELGGADAGLIYDRLRVDMGTPLYLGVYVIGTAAVALHLANGLPAAARRFGLLGSKGAARNARIAAGAFALVLFLVTVNTMSHFVVGDAFFGGAQESER
jgi:succinate dehydrogenase/fumarate reductase cytochrome b subunit